MVLLGKPFHVIIADQTNGSVLQRDNGELGRCSQKIAVK